MTTIEKFYIKSTNYFVKKPNLKGQDFCNRKLSHYQYFKCMGNTLNLFSFECLQIQ